MDEISLQYLKELLAITKEAGIVSFRHGALSFSFGNEDEDEDEDDDRPVSTPNIGFEARGMVEDEETEEDLSAMHSRLFAGRLPRLTPKKGV